MTVILNTEIYRCLSNSNAKRKVVEKFTYNMTEKRYWKVAD